MTHRSKIKTRMKTQNYDLEQKKDSFQDSIVFMEDGVAFDYLQFEGERITDV